MAGAATVLVTRGTDPGWMAAEAAAKTVGLAAVVVVGSARPSPAPFYPVLAGLAGAGRVVGCRWDRRTQREGLTPAPLCGAVAQAGARVWALITDGTGS